MFRDVLVVASGRQSDARLLEYGIDLAAQYGARLHVVAVVDERETKYADDHNRSLLRHRGATAVQDAEELAAYHGVDAVTSVVERIPHETALRYARDHGVDLIVVAVDRPTSLGQYAAGKVREGLIGDATESIIRHARVPVVSVRV